MNGEGTLSLNTVSILLILLVLEPTVSLAFHCRCAPLPLNCDKTRQLDSKTPSLALKMTFPSVEDLI